MAKVTESTILYSFSGRTTPSPDYTNLVGRNILMEYSADGGWTALFSTTTSQTRVMGVALAANVAVLYELNGRSMDILVLNDEWYIQESVQIHVGKVGSVQLTGDGSFLSVLDNKG